MKIHPLFLAAGLLAVFPASVEARIVRTEEKTFTVHPGGELKVETHGGGITIQTSNESTVKVVAREKIQASTEKQADELLAGLKLVMEQRNDGVTATAAYERGESRGVFGTWPPVQVDFTVTVPVNYNIVLKTSGGNVNVSDLMGNVRVRTSGGDIVLGKISGEVSAGTSGGNVRLDEGQSTVKLSTSGGDIRVGRALGPTDLETSGGNIEVKSVENSLEASTSGGDVTAAITGSFKGNCELRTSGGQVRVYVDKNAGFDLDASTSGGGVDADGLAIAIEKGAVGRSRLEGKVNGGGPDLQLRSSGGDILVRTR